MSTNLMFAEAAWNHREWYPARESEYQKAVAARLEKGCRVKATEYIGALRYRDELIKEWEKVLCGFDSLLAPTCPIEAYDLPHKAFKYDGSACSFRSGRSYEE